jgi:hypothetical protein
VSFFLLETQVERLIKKALEYINIIFQISCLGVFFFFFLDKKHDYNIPEHKSKRSNGP